MIIFKTLFLVLVSQTCSFEASKDSVGLGEHFQIKISCPHPRQCSTEISRDSSLWHPFIFKNSPEKSLLTRGEDSLTTVYTLTGAIYSQVDSVQIQLPPALFLDKDTSWTDSLGIIHVFITTSLTGPDDTLLSPLRPRLDFPPRPPEPLYKKLIGLTLRFWYIPLIIIGVTAIAILAYFLIKKSAKKRFYPRSPSETAAIALSRIYRKYLKEDSIVSKEFYEELTDVFKEYSESVSPMKTKKMTVKEIKDIFLKSFYISKEVENSLWSFNNSAELAKFSKQTFDALKGKEDFKTVTDFVNIFPIFKRKEENNKNGK
ncbi:hypothetical protein JXA84_06310 [candidate division WOR-3 bacterium]|nr:hypothetical protein [candidate division WOR-3 bacterium]